MAERAGIIIFTLWYIAIAYNYAMEYRKRSQEDASNIKLSQLSSICDDDEDIEDINESVHANHNISEESITHAKEEQNKESSVHLEQTKEKETAEDVVRDIYEIARDLVQQDDSTDEGATEENYRDNESAEGVGTEEKYRDNESTEEFATEEDYKPDNQND